LVEAFGGLVRRAVRESLSPECSVATCCHPDVATASTLEELIRLNIEYTHRQELFSMNNMNTKLLLGLTVGFAGVGVVNAEEIFVGDCEDCTIPALIEESMTWTADNTYNLQEQIFVLPGATLTIEAGTVVASTPTANGSGSLAVTRGAQIFVNGTLENPVIMTSTNDDFETWREAANEWGNLTVMGDAYISNSFVDGN
jgi:hypothetical protein